MNGKKNKETKEERKGIKENLPKNTKKKRVKEK